MTTPEQRKAFYERHPNYSRDYMRGVRQKMRSGALSNVRWNGEALMGVVPTLSEDPDQLVEWTTAMECQFLRNLYNRYGFAVLRRQAAIILSGQRVYDAPVDVEKVKLSLSKLLFKAAVEEEELDRRFE